MILPLTSRPGFIPCKDPSLLTDDQLAAICVVDTLRKLTALVTAECDSIDTETQCGGFVNSHDSEAAQHG